MRYPRTLLPLFATLIFLFLTLWQITLPGLHYDEVLEVLPAVRLVLGQPTEPFRGAAISFAGRGFPLMIYDYLGTVNTYLSVPFFLLLGINVFSLRLMAILIGVLTLLLTYLLAREMFDERAAAIAVVLLAIHPSFVFWSRQGVFVTSVIGALSVASLLAFVLWFRKKKAPYLYLGAFLVGLGLNAKFSFFWFALGLILAGFLLWVLNARRERAPISLTQAGLGVLFLLLGCWSLVLYNIQTQGTIEIIRKYLFTSYLGVNNLAFLSNLSARVEQFMVMLKGGQFWYLGGVFGNTLYPFLFLLITLSAVVLVFLRRRPWWRGVALLVIVLLVMLPLSAFTPTGLKPEHYIIFLPWPQLLIGAGLALWKKEEPRRLGLPLAILAFSLLFLFDLRVDLEYHRALAKTGGFDGHTAAIYDLSAYLEGEDASTVAMDWGIRNQVFFLTEGRIDAKEVFGFENLEEPDPGFPGRLAEFLSDPSTLYIFHNPQESVFQRWEAFRALAGEVQVRRVVLDRSGKQIFWVVKLAEP